MQKFIVSPSIGGPHLTWNAVKFLSRLNNMEGVPFDAAYELKDNELSESNGEVGCPETNTYSPLLSMWWSYYRDRHKDEVFCGLNGDESVYLGVMYAKPLRDRLVPMLEELGGDYSKLDSLNCGCELRLVEVPDGYHCGVVEDPETGCEVVEEYPRIWVPMKDDEYRFVRIVRELCHKASVKRKWNCNATCLVYDRTTGDGYSVKIATHKDYGVAKCTKDGEVSYLFLKKNTYYTATDDHGQECYEIVGDKENKFRLPVLFHSGNEVKTYCELITFIESKTEQSDE